VDSGGEELCLYRPGYYCYKWCVRSNIRSVPYNNAIYPFFSGTCPPGITSATDTTCWWTCTGCTRSTDITACPDKNTWGLTYDDGPGYYTPNLLDFLGQESLHATFFTVGSRCLEFPQTLQAEYMAGHQIAVHTWSHPELTTLSNEQVIAELGWSRKIIKDVLGVTPTMMRPPYGDIECVFFPFLLYVCFDIKPYVLKTVTVFVTSLWPWA
jgi:hypothetical protein